ncbi:MAG TPA: hypothetical protein VMU76_07710 [Acidimicrobiales bacterium]|nr:hypothetical protein [Acidimicrobiales bacterium]
MTTQNPHGSHPDNDTADLVRSVALSSARLWEEVLERLVRVERSQVELTQTLSRLQAALPSATSTTSAPGLSGPSARTLGLPAAPPPSPPPPVGAAVGAIEVDGVEVGNYQANGGSRALSALGAAGPDAVASTPGPQDTEGSQLGEPVLATPSEPVSDDLGTDILAPPPPPPGFASGGDVPPPPPPPGFSAGTEPEIAGGEFLAQGPSELPEPQRGRRFGLRRKARKDSAPVDQTTQVPVDSILAAAGEGAQPEKTSAAASLAGTAGAGGTATLEEVSVPQAPAPAPAPAPGSASVETDTGTGAAEPLGLHALSMTAPPEPWGIQPEPTNEGGAPSPTSPAAWAPAPPPPEPAWAAAPPPPDPAWAAAPPPPDPAWAAAPPPPDPAWAAAPPPPDPAWAAAAAPQPPPPPVVTVVPSAPAAPAVPAAPAGFSLEDLQGEGAIGASPSAPPPSPIAPSRPVEPVAPAVPAAPAGFSLEDLQGEGAIGASPSAPPPPPPPPPGFSAPSGGAESLGLDPAPDRDERQMPPAGWESITPPPPPPPPPPPMPEGGSQAPPLGFEPTEVTGRPTAPPPPAGFSAADFSGHDAIGGSAEPPPAPSPATLMGGQVPEPPITPDFFARSGRKRH